MARGARGQLWPQDRAKAQRQAPRASARAGAPGAVCGGRRERGAGRAVGQPACLHDPLPALRQLRRRRHPAQGEVGPGRRAAGEATGHPRLRQRHAAGRLGARTAQPRFPSAGWRPSACWQQVDKSPEHAPRAARADAQGQHTGLQKLPAGLQGPRHPEDQPQPDTRPLGHEPFPQSDLSWAWVQIPGLLPGPGVRVAPVLTEKPPEHKESQARGPLVTQRPNPNPGCRVQVQGTTSAPRLRPTSLAPGPCAHACAQPQPLPSLPTGHWQPLACCGTEKSSWGEAAGLLRAACRPPGGGGLSQQNELPTGPTAASSSQPVHPGLTARLVHLGNPVASLLSFPVKFLLTHPTPPERALGEASPDRRGWGAAPRGCGQGARGQGAGASSGPEAPGDQPAACSHPLRLLRPRAACRKLAHIHTRPREAGATRPRSDEAQEMVWSLLECPRSRRSTPHGKGAGQFCRRKLDMAQKCSSVARESQSTLGDPGGGDRRGGSSAGTPEGAERRGVGQTLLQAPGTDIYSAGGGVFTGYAGVDPVKDPGMACREPESRQQGRSPRALGWRVHTGGPSAPPAPAGWAGLNWAELGSGTAPSPSPGGRWAAAARALAEEGQPLAVAVPARLLTLAPR
ncbi:uncharacterized protein LOC116590245 [Mustela erminea]|uniref:uncharacterized protein LOC116590245 n=1 Tax=Mustela erminea TaxID=36723 RepID=UPI001386DD54|nr:uncharacterized protein LOC116590245 [Mustela erminea]